MDSAPETEPWVICHVCQQPSPAGKSFCRHCCSRLRGRTVSFQKMEEISKQRLSYLKRRKVTKVITISLASLLTLALVVHSGLYHFTDILFKPPQGVNSDSLPGEWAMFRHDLGRSGSTDTSDLLPQGTLKWTFSTGGAIHSSPAVAGGTVYVGSRDNKLYALDAVTGAKHWEYETTSWVESSPAIANGIVYFGSNDGRLYALDAHSGERLWDFNAQYPVISSPAVSDGIVYFGSLDYHIYALDTVEGTKLWDFEANSYVMSSPTINKGIVYIGSGDNFFYALNALNGRLRLHFKTYSPVVSSPAVSSEIIYFTTDNGYLYAVDGNARNWPQEHELKPYWVQLWFMGLLVPKPPAQSGSLWSLRIGRKTSSSPVFSDDTLYVGTDDKLVATDIKSHQKRWEFESEGIIRSSPAAVDTTVYVGSEDGRLYAVDAATGEKLWDIQTGGKITSSPAVADGTVYIGSHDGNLYAIK
ncbi:PQQ-binding-like beta-propeller repeat protein [Chloroflexota bacterium]